MFSGSKTGGKMYVKVYESLMISVSGGKKREILL